ncbi:putative ferrichrome siderophore peptide synthetase [Testicularia cyperi]|uniref:Putative ferrichrome siderophore peptide synthetase n=1 Tax=Testicularia cyperi TaxID=1882483 RepID=A0A317XWB3_9BASI|nr:putative ferrichrome siderophore peptide synthetase [Testicularia cyperi]
MPASGSHAPFPDVTGLRTSGPDFNRVGDHCEFHQVDLETKLDADKVAKLAHDDLGLSLLSAWSAILFHYGSHEASNVEVVQVPPSGQESVVELDFAHARERDSFGVSDLVDLIARQQRQAASARDLEHGYAALVMPAVGEHGQAPQRFRDLRQQQRKDISLALGYHTSHAHAQDGEGAAAPQLVLHLKATPAVHSKESALLQLQQVAALLESYLGDAASHALSLERFDWKLRASDNPKFQHLADPDHLRGRHPDRLESEFEYFAETTPDALALDFRFDLEDKVSAKWTYAEMNQRAEKVKQLLWSHGVGSASGDAESDHIVALYLEKSPETYLSFIGVLKAGAAWCPIDTDWPASRRQALLAKANAKIVLTHDDRVAKQLQEDLDSDDVKSKGGMVAIRLDRLDEELENVQASAAKHAGSTLASRSIEQLAYMIWTSGTTGLPKGVGIQHLAIIQAMRALRIYIPYGKDRIGTDGIRYLQYSAYNFDLSIMDCFYTWGLGGTICSCPRGVLLQDLVEVGNSIKPTHTLLTPAVMAMTERHRVPSLKVVISGGEKLSQVVADEWSKECCLLNLYGPAEATLIAMNRRVPFGDRVKAPNIGVALPTVSCHALDRADKVVLKGAVGELVLGGPQLARGYVGDPVKTADKFFPHPQLGRVYRTGDLVRQLGNQEFEYLGRIDDQVKINGIRIELLEINAAIKNSHALIKDSETMAFPKPGNDSEQQIINFSALPGGSSELLRTDAEAVQVARELQQNAKESLPSYMIPNMFVILSHFPRTSSAKIDRVALKNVLANFDQLEWENKLAGEDEDDSGAAGGEATEAEQCLRKWLAKLCNVAPEKIGRKTPFTSVGLDSIRAMTFSQRLTQEGYSVSVLDVTRYPTLLSLSQKLSNASSGSDAQERQRAADELFARFDQDHREAVVQSLSVTSDDVLRILPCTPLQEGMLAESQRDTLSYRIQRQYRIPSSFDSSILRAALQKAVDQLESLRTSFVDIGSLDTATRKDSQSWPFDPHFLQVVWHKAQPRVETLHLDPSDNIEERVVRYASEELAINPFSRSPPVAFVLVSQAEERYLIFVAHHSTFDARSLGIFEDWVEALYNGTKAPQTLQFAAALSHILPLSSEDAEQKRTTWLKALADYPKGEAVPFPLLSTSKPDLNIDQANVHETHHLRANITWKQIEAACRQLGVSARPLVQTAWARVLAAYLDTEHLILGDSVSGRTLSAELDQVYGPVLSTVPVPFRLKSGQSVQDLVRATDAFQTSVMEVQHTDLGAIRKMLQLAPGEPLFHCVFVLEPAPQNAEGDADSPAFRLHKVADLGVATEHTLGVEVLPHADGSVNLGLSCHRAVVSGDFARLMLEQFAQSLADVCANISSSREMSFAAQFENTTSDERLFSLSRQSRVKSIEDAARTNIASQLWTAAELSSATAVEVYHELPTSASRRSPSAHLTYEQLQRASDSVASTIMAGLPANSVVAVCLPRSLESYIVPLAILKAGHAYLPLDETLPVERKRELLADSQAALLVASEAMLQGVELPKLDTLDVGSDRFQAAIAIAIDPATADASASVYTVSNPDDVAFIIYTSGSTGKPKGCILTYQNLSCAIEAFRLSYEREAPGSFAPNARFLARSAEAFDVHLLEIFLSLRTGATIVTGPRALIHEDIGLTLQVLEITHACVVPSLFYSRGERIRPESVPNLRALIIGGEALPQDLCELWGSDGDQRPVVLNAYGPSEATIGTSVARVHRDSRPSNIGAPFPGTRYMVLKELDGQLVPTLRGEPGELCIGGLQVAKGYLHRPELTSFVQWNNEWIYRTGDLVRLHPGDEAEYLGRMDGSQVKVRGARLELGEVDAALAACLSQSLGKAGSAVTILSHHPGIQAAPRLVSFFAQESRRTSTAEVTPELVIGSAEATTAANELRRAVRGRLPQYMVPSVVLPLAFLPISPLSGKVDRKALQALYTSMDPGAFASAHAEKSRPFTDEEEKVAEVLRATIRLDEGLELTPTTDLITAGLDSLSVVTLSGKLRKMGFDATAASILNDPTIEAIVRKGPDHGLSRTAGSSPSMQDFAAFDREVERLTQRAKQAFAAGGVEVEYALPCVPMQEALISQAAAEGTGAPRYMTTIVIDIDGDYPSDAIRDAWRQSLVAHPIYRTVFADVGGQLAQVVLSPGSYQLAWNVVPRCLPTSDQLAKVHQRVATEMVASLSTSPPLRLQLWNAPEPSRRHLTLTCSHAIYDGESLKLLLSEVSNRLRGTPPDFMQSSPVAFSQVTREIMSQSNEAAKTFWTRKLDGFSQTPVPNLTGLRPEARREKPATAAELTISSKHKLADIETVARSQRVTVHSILLGAFGCLLGLYAGEDDVTLGLVLSGRTLPVDQIDTVHGPCITTVPFRLQNARKAEPHHRSQAVHRAINEILPYQHVSITQLMRWLGLDRSPIEALFSYLGAATTPSPSEAALAETTTIMERDYSLALEVAAKEGSIELHLAYSTSHIPEPHARLMLEQYDSILQATLQSAAASADHSERLLSVLNRECYVPSDASESLVSRFQRHSHLQPDAPAIAFATSLEAPASIMTYSELDQLSTTIASHLTALSNQFVGVHLTKDGPELYAAILAVWKAGKTYLPLDPTLPKERLEYMVETVGDCPVIATRSTAKNFAGSSCKVMELAELLQPSSAVATLPPSQLDVPCYLLFTSGSTGKPKAVQISQRALAAALYSWERILPFQRHSRFLQLASIGFDVSLIELCMPLSLGFSIGTAPKAVLLEDLTAAIQHLGITIADLPAALAGTVHPDDVELEWLMSGGDVIDSRVIEEWNAAGRRLINAWGPTEATIGNTLGEIQQGATRNMIGRVYPTSSMYVVDESSTRVLPRGAIGELVVGGPQVADKYYGRDDLTAEKFIRLDDGSRVYRTGDLGRFLFDGSVECLGRIGSDRQVKVNGQRMELDEVSSVLSAQSGIHDADVQYLKHPALGSKQLVAFVAQTGHCANAGELKARDDDEAVALSTRLEQQAIKRLAPYMIPSHWIVTSRALPLSHNNKIDHKALAEFYSRMDASALRSFGAKRDGALANTTWTEVEQQLRAVVADFCGIESAEIAKTTSFHRLGIDSISAIRLVKSLRNAGFAVTVAELMSAPYISALAEKQQQGSHSASTAEDKAHDDGAELKRWTKKLRASVDPATLEVSEDDTIEAILPCTPLQTGMIAQTLARSGLIYFHHHAFRIAKSREEVAGAWKRLVERLDILRTTFHTADGSHPWVQVVHTAVLSPKIVLHRGDFRMGSDAELDSLEGQPAFVDEQAFAQAPHVLHLWTRATDDATETVALLSIHHSLYDGSSLPQLLDDFELLLRDEEKSLPQRLSFARLTPALLSREVDVAFWTEKLRGLQPVLLSPKHSTDDSRSSSAVLVERDLAQTPEQLESFCRPLGVSLQVLCNLAFAKVLALESQTRDVCFGQLFGLLDVAVDADTAVGPAFNTVATRVRFNDLSRSVRDVLLDMQEANDRGRPHRRAALREVQARLQRGSLFDALFDYQRAYDEETGRLLQPIPLSEEGLGGPQYALNVAVVQGPSQMSIMVKADASLYGKAELDAVADKFQAVLLHLLDSIDGPVSALPPSVDRTFPQQLSENSAQHMKSEDSAQVDQSGPLDEDGQRLASIIADVSGVPIEQIGGNTKLVSLGLDSISAIRIASQARRTGLRVGMAHIISGETIHGILSRRAQTNGVNGHHAAENSTPATPRAIPQGLAVQIEAEMGVGRDKVLRVLPLLPGQMFWLATWARTNGGGGFSFAYRLAGAEPDKVRATWAKLRKLQPILRTAFLPSTSQGARQVVLDASVVSEQTQFSVVESSSGESESTAVRSVVAKQAAQGWPSLSQPPLQLTLVGRDTLVFSLHHLLYDAFSIDFMVRDFAALYHGGDEDSLSSSTQWIEAVDRLVAEQNEAAHFWKGALSGATAGLLPPSQTNASSEEAFHFEPSSVSLPSDADAKLRAAGLTLPAVVVASWSSVLSGIISAGPSSSSSNPVFGMYHLGRSADIETIDKIQGPLLSVLPMATPGSDVVQRAKSAVQQLRSRSSFEQSQILDVHRAAGLPVDAPSYNTFLNLLLRPASEQDKSTSEASSGELQRLDLGNPTDYSHRQQKRESVTAGQDVHQLASVLQPDVNIDVVVTGQSIGIGIKACSSIVPASQIPALIERFADEIRNALASI